MGIAERMEEERMVRRIMRADVSGVRLRDRTQMRWMDTLKRIIMLSITFYGACTA